MKKKVLLVVSFLLLAAIGWFVYQAMNTPVEKVVEIDSDSKEVEVDSKIPPSLKVSPQVSAPAAEEASSEKVNYRVSETPDEKFEAFDQMEKTWLGKARKIIGEDKYAAYLDLRERNEKEKLQAYKEYHDYLRQKYGDNFSYNISDDQSVREQKINQRYLKDLLALIGPEKFKSYTAAKDQINEEMRRKNTESIQIEF